MKIIWLIKAFTNIENTLCKNRFIDETSKRNNFGINDDDIIIKDEKKLAVIIYQQENEAILLSIILSVSSIQR